VEGAKVEAMTFPLLTTATGAKMGKTAEGAVWLDGNRLKPYDFYQYWVNCDDRDVGRFLRLFTFLPMDEIRRLDQLEGSDLREAKQILAYETTRITHGDGAAAEAREAAAAAFGLSGGGDLEAMPRTSLPVSRLEEGVPPAELFADVGLAASRGEAKRLIKQGGAYVNDRRIDSPERLITKADLTDKGILLRAGKKKYHRITAE
jgi:tyrosyl-tRNA synthetase